MNQETENSQMPDSDVPGAAKKHVWITRRIRTITKSVHVNWDVYMATYSADKDYRALEMVGGREFWSIRAYAPSSTRRTKDPDAIIVQGRQVKFLVEVKWGTVLHNPKSDLRLSQDEQEEMKQLVASPGWCRARGPVIKDGRLIPKEEFDERDFSCDDQTKLILVSDFVKMKKDMPVEFSRFVSLAEKMKATFEPADIETGIMTQDGKIRSLREILEAK